MTAKRIPSVFAGIALGPDENGLLIIGTTNDILYGGDMSGDAVGMGVALDSADGKKHFGLAVFGDDAGTELSAGWVSSIFGSYVIYTAVTPSVNLSAFGVAGQLHIGASVSTIGNLAGVYGVVEGDGSETITGNAFGVLAGFTLGASQTLASGYYMGGIMVGGSNNGTTTGLVVGMFMQNPSGNQFDAAFAFGQDSQMAGVVTAAAVSGSNTHKLKVYAGGTLYYIPMYTA
jgi:hypothetical protein